ncbi:MAG: hypothetical protein MUO26_11530 [Methanotrichaceae archaeon]|nr:hypothetical protein [Methanotrichaceae archaeon]
MILVVFQACSVWPVYQDSVLARKIDYLLKYTVTVSNSHQLSWLELSHLHFAPNLGLKGLVSGILKLCLQPQNSSMILFRKISFSLDERFGTFSKHHSNITIDY